MRPVCIKCEKEMRCSLTGITVRLDRNRIATGDAYRCPTCGFETVHGFGEPYISEKLTDLDLTEKPADNKANLIPHLTEDMAGRTVLGCPLCKTLDNHILEVKVNAGGEITVVNVDGTSMEYGKPVGRGSQTLLKFACENCRHIWVLGLRFVKGIMFADIIDEGDAGIESSDDSLRDIWRD